MGSKGRGGRARQQPNRASVVKQMQDLQERMLKAQQELAAETVTASVGGGAVTVVMDGQQQVRQVMIAAEAVDPAEVDMLQDMVMAAMNEALGKARQLSEEKMAPLTGALGMPGLL
jgi:DNA-binding YbaB/EbfC family protein